MKRSIVSVAALFIFATSAMAQVEEHSQINFLGTGIFTKNTTSGPNSYDSANSGGGLVGYSYQFNRWASAEGNYGFTRNNQNYSGSNGQASIRSDIHELSGSFVARIPAHLAGFRPFALAGAGALIFDPTDQNTFQGAARQAKAAFIYGGGADINIVHNFGVRAEYRGFVFKAPDFTLSGLNLDKVTHIAQPSVGFFVHF
jgi:opacity protein-like surface antigen